MPSSDIKKEIHALIDSINGEEELNVLHEIAASYAHPRNDADNLTPEEIRGIELAKQQVLEGKVTSNEDVSKQAREWVARNKK